MLWIWIAAMFGISRFRGAAYWKWVGILAAWMFVLPLLIDGRGDLQHPENSGLITRQIQIATNDGPAVLLFLVPAVILYWGGVIFICRKLWKNGKLVEEQHRQRNGDSVAPVALSRKLGEAAIVTAIAAIWIYFTMIAPPLAAQTPAPVLTSTPQGEAPDPVARDLAAAANELTLQGPKMLDSLTKLVRVTSEGRVLIYHHEIVRRDVTNDQIRAFIRKSAVASACKDRDLLASMKDYGITYRYSYMFPNADVPVDIDATYQECQAK